MRSDVHYLALEVTVTIAEELDTSRMAQVSVLVVSDVTVCLRHHAPHSKRPPTHGHGHRVLYCLTSPMIFCIGKF